MAKVRMEVRVDHWPKELSRLEPDYAAGTHAWQLPAGNRDGKPAPEFWCAQRAVDGKLIGTVTYFREDHAEFESTYRQICESFRVID